MRWARGVARLVRRQHVADSLLALVMWVLSAAPVAAPNGGALLQTGLLTAACVALIWRRDRPLTVLVVAMSCDLASIVVAAGYGPTVAAMFALYTVCLYGPVKRGWIVAGSALVVYTGVLTLLAFADLGRIPGEPVIAFFFVLFAVSMGQFVRLRRELAQRRRAEAANTAVRAERQRIARELHDVVAHHVTTMNVLVGAARTTMRRDPETAATTLATAERSGREAMSEMRQLLFALRTDDVPDDEVVAAGVDRLPVLVVRANESGLPAVLEQTGERVRLPVAVDRAIYRLVQESLTNVRKHACAASTTIFLCYAPTELTIEVVNGNPGRPVDKERFSSSGYGLAGMAERVAFCGGELKTGPTESGGFRVYACFPVTG